MRESEMLELTICVWVNSFVETLINMLWELKITSGSKKNDAKITAWSDIPLESY